MNNDILSYIPDFNIGNVLQPSEVRYLYNDLPVPRVSDILDMVNNPYLLEWANRVGLYQHKSHIEYQDLALSIGTYVHDFIYNYITRGVVPDFNLVSPVIRTKVKHAFTAFCKWWSIISQQDYSIICAEEQMTCKYFGGTCDLAMIINGKKYLIDFKTSKMPSYKHALQLAAYRYLLRETKSIELDGGCIALMLSKMTDDFKEIGYYLHNEDSRNFLDYCEESFLSLVYSYYCVSRVQYTFNNMEM